jgi:hypothetical protein
VFYISFYHSILLSLYHCIFLYFCHSIIQNIRPFRLAQRWQPLTGIVECLTLDLVEFGAVGLVKAEVEAKGSEDGSGGQEE